MLHAEREVVLHARDSGKVDDEVLRDVLNLLDAEESLLDRLEDKGGDVERELVARVERVRSCEHLTDAPASVKPTYARRVRGVPARRHPLGPPPPVPDLRARRLLRLLAVPACDRAPRRDRAPGHPQLRAGRGVALVLRRRAAGLAALLELHHEVGEGGRRLPPGRRWAGRRCGPSRRRRRGTCRTARDGRPGDVPASARPPARTTPRRAARGPPPTARRGAGSCPR